MEWISKRYGINIIEKKNIGGNCEACQWLFHNKQISNKIPEALDEKNEEIFGEMQIMDALGLLEPGNISKLWCDVGTFI